MVLNGSMDLIAFEPACSSENFDYVLGILPWENSICLVFPIWPTFRQSSMSILNVNIIFAPLFNLSNLAKPLVFVCFWFWAAWIVA